MNRKLSFHEFLREGLKRKSFLATPIAIGGAKRLKRKARRDLFRERHAQIFIYYLLPLNCRWRFRADIIYNSVHALNFVYYIVRNFH